MHSVGRHGANKPLQGTGRKWRAPERHRYAAFDAFLLGSRFERGLHPLLGGRIMARGIRRDPNNGRIYDDEHESGLFRISCNWALFHGDVHG
jgi:hypothetical protein